MVLVGKEVGPNGNSSPPPPIHVYAACEAGHEPTPLAILDCVGFSTRGAEPSSDSELASLPLECSKKIPYPPRMAVLPSPNGSQAKPRRGPGLIKWPERQPGLEFPPTAPERPPGALKVPPFPPH